MNKYTSILATAALVALSACGGTAEPAPSATNEADEFAARINGNAPAAQGNVAPTVAEPLPGAAEGAFAAGTATDPQSATCGANLMGPFLGKVADNQTRIAVTEAAGPGREIRFLRPGGAFINPDPTNPRLNLMLDNQDIIRDARCG